MTTYTLRTLFAAALLTVATTAQAGMYKCATPSGGIALQDTPCTTSGQQVLVPTGPTTAYRPPAVAAVPAEVASREESPRQQDLPTPKATIAFGEDTWHRQYGLLRVQGIVKNTSTTTAQWVRISVRGLDRAGHLVAIEEAYTSPYHLAPGQEATYTVTFTQGAGVQKLQRTVSWR